MSGPSPATALLRQVLRGLVPSRRRDPSLQAWHHEHLLFICTTKDYDRFTFGHFRGDKPQTAKLVTFGWQKGDRHLRTVYEFNLPALEWPEENQRGQSTFQLVIVRFSLFYCPCCLFLGLIWGE